MTITIADLFLILPVLVLTGTAVLAMSAVAVGRNYPVTAFITVAGLLLAALSAVTLMPGTNQQVTPLLIVDPYSLFFTAVICLSAMFIAVLSYPYLEGLDDDREEYFLLLGVALSGGCAGKQQSLRQRLAGAGDTEYVAIWHGGVHGTFPKG